jgi:2-methylisocitrate lyase-like PEP mutase family enzyme
MPNTPPTQRGLSASSAQHRPRFKALVEDASRVVLPGVPDAMTARLAERAGFLACYISGAGYANAQLALPDVGLVSRDEISGHVRNVSEACGIPVVVDGDTGFGGPIAVMRTVRAFELAGASAIQLEDQRMPKRCGHFAGKSLVSTEEMVSNVRAAKLAGSPGFTVIARTDARAIEGIEPACARAQAYRDAGADVLFVEAPETLEELELVPKRLPDVPLMVNVVEGGLTPELTAADYFEMGYHVVLFANFVMRVMAKAAAGALAHLHGAGETTSLQDQMLSWAQRQELVGFGNVEELETFLTSQEHSGPEAQRT